MRAISEQQRQGHIRLLKDPRRTHWEKLGRTYGPIYGPLNGARNVETGHAHAMGRIYGPKNGRRQGKLSAASGLLDKVRTYRSCSRGGRVSTHLRWHIARGIRKPDTCDLCSADGKRGAPGHWKKSPMSIYG